MIRRRTPSEDEISRIYTLLDRPASLIDCGKLCEKVHGTPLCCTLEGAIPTLFTWEWKYLRPRTAMWRRLRIAGRPDAELLRDRMGQCDILARCRGATVCDRSHRSFTCRVFPLEPYMETDGTMVGVIFNTDFEGKCPLWGRPRMLRREFVRACIVAWAWLVGIEPEMWEAFTDWSATLRRSCGQTGREVRGFDMNGRWRVLRPGRLRRGGRATR